MIKGRSLLVALVGIFVISTSLMAKRFANTYLEFTLPDTWHCIPEGGQHICQPVNPDQRKEAIIVMASKYKGPEDDMKHYYARLQEKREVRDVKGKKYKSKKRYTKYNTILGTIWIDSQHEDSEVPGFITRYLATVAKGLGIVVTFSAHETKYKQYTSDFHMMISSIRVSENIPAPVVERDRARVGTILGRLGVLGKKKVKKPAERKVTELEIPAGEEKDNTLIYILVGVVALVIGYIIIRRRRKRR